MIDWSNVHFPLSHTPINSGEVLSIDPDGEVEWRSPKRVKATGSYKKELSIKSIGGDGTGQATHLWLNGNPSKFLQGHNIFGSDDPISLLYDVFLMICEQFNLKPSDSELCLVKKGDYPIKTVDINYSYRLPSRSDVLAFIRALEFKAKTRHGRPSTKGGTLYFGQHSSYWAIKFYCKAEEILIKRGRLPLDIQGKGLEDWVDDILRVELRLHAKELKRLEIFTVKDLYRSGVNGLFTEYLERIDMTDQIKLSDKAMLNIPNKYLSTYVLWSEGHDLRNKLSKPTYYRHRKALLEFGINIDLRPDSINNDFSNVIPLVRVLEAKPASIPSWAFEKGLVHHSAS